MDPYKLTFEKTLFLFDWGQDEARNHCTSLTSIKLKINDILSERSFEDVIARYHNWYRVFSSKDKTQMSRKDVIMFRQECVGVIHSRMINEMPNHPALRIYLKECQALDTQDCISCLPLNCVDIETHLFLLVNRLFI